MFCVLYFHRELYTLQKEFLKTCLEPRGFNCYSGFMGNTFGGQIDYKIIKGAIEKAEQFNSWLFYVKVIEHDYLNSRPLTQGFVPKGQYEKLFDIKGKRVEIFNKDFYPQPQRAIYKNTPGRPVGNPVRRKRRGCGSARLYNRWRSS